jgi:hypothetical protein
VPAAPATWRSTPPPGRQARVIGLIGDDEAGRLLEESLAAQGAPAPSSAPDAPTITKLRVISRHQQLIRLDFEERFDACHAPGSALPWPPTWTAWMCWCCPTTPRAPCPTCRP